MSEQDDPRRSSQDGFRSDEAKQQDETAASHGSEVNRARLNDRNTVRHTFLLAIATHTNSISSQNAKGLGK
jgi:hypothetical protein